MAGLAVSVRWTACPESICTGVPAIRSRYVPAAIPVVIVVSRLVVSLLIATKPLSPRENAIALAPLSHQWLISLPATTCRKRTMFLMDGSRCSQTHWPALAVSRLVAHVTGNVQPAASEGGPSEFCDGQANT